MRTLNIVTLILLIIGGLNWGLVGLFEFNLVAAIFGEMSLLSQIIYILVGLSALWQIIALARGNHAERRVYTHVGQKSRRWDRRPGASESFKSADDFFRLEEIGDFDCGVFVAVGAMNRVRFDGFGKGLADRAFGGEIGRALV